ncbi:MAG: Uma2 family endonuclease, partial [Cyanobacteria bacterium J06559_3]
QTVGAGLGNRSAGKPTFLNQNLPWPTWETGNRVGLAQVCVVSQWQQLNRAITMNPDLLDLNLERLPGSEELPDSDDTPVDNENQNTLPNWLLAVLENIWGDRQDWYFGVDMGIYNREAQAKRAPLVIPDGFLSLGVQRHKRNGLGRLSYVLQEENEIPPTLVLEMVSQTYGKEYEEKLLKYRQLGVKYYVIYNREYTRRDQHQPFEVYKLVDGRYQLQSGEPFWMPEIGLGIGRMRGELGGINREWLAWYDQNGQPYPLPSQLIRQERQRAYVERQRADVERQRADTEQQRADTEQQRADAERQARLQEQQRADQAEQEKLELLAKLKQLGIDPEQL